MACPKQPILLDPSTWRPGELDIGITARCNQRCKYCYLERAADSAQGDMSPEVAAQIVEYVSQLSTDLPPRKRVALNFFGGEPFLNFAVVQQIILAAEKRQLPIGKAIFTNGATATPEQVAWCREHDVLSKRSVGGCPEACQHTRPGDYLQWYERESAWWDDYHRPRRITTIPETAKYLMQSMKYFYSKGYYGSLDFATDDYADWPLEAIDEYKVQTERLAKEFVRQFKLGCVLGNEVLQLFARKIFANSQTMTIGCGAGWGLQAITFDGYLMPCHRFLNEPRDSVMCGGKLSDFLAGNTPQFGKDLYQYAHLCSKGVESPQCRECETRQSCQHGCRHLSWVTSGDFWKTPDVRCIFTRHWRRLAIWVHSELALFDPKWFEREATKCQPIPEEA
jgi:uncharacterized protein